MRFSFLISEIASHSVFMWYLGDSQSCHVHQASSWHTWIWLNPSMQIQRHLLDPDDSLIIPKVLLSWFVIWLHSGLCRELFCFEAESYTAVLLNQEYMKTTREAFLKCMHYHSSSFYWSQVGCDHGYFEKPSPSDSDIHLCWVLTMRMVWRA